MKKPIEVLQNATQPPTATAAAAAGGEVTTAVDWDYVRAALEDLEEHAEDIDKANDIGTMGGVAPLLALVASGEDGVPARAATVLGQMASNNMKAQTLLTEQGAVPALLQAVRAGNDPATQSKLLYALGGISRNFPAAQEVGFVEGGASLIYELISSKHAKLQRRATTLSGDLAAQHTGWGVWLGSAVRRSKAEPLLEMLQDPAKRELHETALTVLVGVLTRPIDGKSALVAEAEAEALLEAVQPAVQAYLERAKAGGDNEQGEDGFKGPQLARALVGGPWGGLGGRLAAEEGAGEEEL